MPKVSVIIPVYNVEEYLSQCLDSVKSQTLRDIEIICVDDGSTDSSLSILRSYEKLDSRIIVISQKNQGAGAARNRGLILSTGDYIAFMDPDDFYPDEMVLNDLYNAVIDNCVDVAGGSLIEVLPDKKYRDDYPVNDGRKFFCNALMNYSEYQYDYYYQRFLYSKELLKNNNIVFPLYRRHQDVLFFVKTMVSAKVFYSMERCTYCYRVNHKVVNWTREVAVDIASAINEVIRITKENNLDVLHKRVVKRLFIQYAENIFTFAGFENLRVILHQAISNIKFELFAEKQFHSNIEDFMRINVFHKKMHAAKENTNVDVLVDEREDKETNVSVIIPVHNVEKYLIECLDSVVTQSLKNIDIICVNDGSTDSSLSILLEIAKKDKRVVVLSQENKGLASARNVGVLYAKGKYICFLDSDDKLISETLMELYGKADNEKLDVLYYDADSFYETENIKSLRPEYKNYYARSNSYVDVVDGKQLFVNMMKNGEYRTSACLHFLRREYYFQNKLYFIPGTLHEDNFFAFDCMLKGKRVAHISKRFYQRRVREDSIMTVKKTFSHSYGYFRNACEMLKVVNSYGLSNFEQKYAIELIEGMLRNSRHIFDGLDESEKNVVQTLENVERYLFDLVILSKLSKKTNTNKLIQQTNVKTNDKSNFIQILIKTKRCYEEYGFKYTVKKILTKIKG